MTTTMTSTTSKPKNEDIYDKMFEMLKKLN